jgi:hypothetical protein
MFNVCYGCGIYLADKIIDSAGPYAVCPECGHRHPFTRQPLFTVGGASGTGKSALLQALSTHPQPAVCLETDILWRPEFARPDEGYRDFFETWLRMAKNIGWADRPVALFGAGFAVAENLEACVERRYFGPLHILALVCDDDVLARRLRERPAWRGVTEHFIAAQLSFNRWLREQGTQPGPSLSLLDTSALTIDQESAEITRWLSHTLGNPTWPTS